MSSNVREAKTARKFLIGSASILAAATALAITAPAAAQEDEEEGVIVTGTRVTTPGVQSASPIVSVGAAEIELQQDPSVERILANMPATLAADGQNVNNGTAGAATINLRGLGPQRNLIMIDGRRLVPFGALGQVDTQQIPTAFLERIDVITGGASAVYGSDAISGAINFVLRRDFEGVEFDADRSITGEGDGEIFSTSLNLGANVADGRGNVAMNLTYSRRSPVTLGARPLGRLGIETATGAGLAEFLAGQTAAPPADPLCQGESAVAAGGSATTLPTRITLVGSALPDNLRQFRTDGSIGPNCSVFNFNPYNFYQTPQERFGGTAIAHYEINRNAEAYGRFTFANTLVSQQIAPSGIFNSSFFINMDNPFIQGSVRSALIAAAEAERGNTVDEASDPSCVSCNWRDNNSNGIVDAPDDLQFGVRRRTVEFGPRSTTFNADTFQLAGGVRGEIGESGWDYDLYISHGRVNTTNVSAGYTNVAHIEDQMLTTDGVTCRDSTDAACVPLNIFGPLITDQEAIAYGRATALSRNLTQQTVASAIVSGEMPFHLPTAQSPVGMSFGAEYRWESSEFVPDECLKFDGGTGCLGGGGGALPLAGEYDVFELFGEAIIPLIEDSAFARSLDLEIGYRYSDYNLSGGDETYKYGINWEPMEGLRIRAMRQQAARAPNVSELFTPESPGLANAVLDPCSVTNAAAFPDATLTARCIATGMTAAQVGVVDDGVVSGQIPDFFGTRTGELPQPEHALTTTVGFVWAPTFDSWIQRPVISVDWYNIEVSDFIGTYGAQEILDGCYTFGDNDLCDLIVRVSGELSLTGAGVQQFTQNLYRAQAEGIEVSARFGVGLGNLGDLTFDFQGNHYLTNEVQSKETIPAIDCLGFYGVQCGNPLPQDRWVQRTTWDVGDFQFSYLWRHLGDAAIEPAQYRFPNDVYQQFRTIDAYDYVDVTAAWNLNPNVRLSGSIRNISNEDPPIVGNEAATTATNSGNTFPGVYDTLGRVYAVGVNLRF